MLSGAIALFACSSAPTDPSSSSSLTTNSCTTDADCKNGFACQALTCVEATSTEDAGSAADSGPTCSTDTWSFSLPTCAACASGSCCAELAACDGDATCTKYRDCTDTCSTEDCVTACGETYAEGAAVYAKLDTCLGTTCKTKCVPKVGIDGACNTSSDCTNGECSDNAKWCVAGCTSNADCLGSGTGGGNGTNGYFNYCVQTSAGGECFPGCTSNADCSSYGFGACDTSTQVTGGAVYTCGTP
jgi:hypothetical protein